MTAQDKKTLGRERRALIKARFSLADALVMCGHDQSVRSHPDMDDPCPCCGAPDVNYYDDRRKSGQRKTDDVAAATHFSCEACQGSGDAISYVFLASGNANAAASLDRIENWLDREK